MFEFITEYTEDYLQREANRKIVLVLCEESQTVCKAFRTAGHFAFSCDLLPCSGGFPYWHFQGDAIQFLTDCVLHRNNIGRPDLVIAHPPCTYLSSAGNRYFNIDRYGDKARERWKQRYNAVDFVQKIYNICYNTGIPCCIENPVGFLNTHWKKPDQIIHPYFFGDPYCKKTCLWLYKLPQLQPSDMLPKPETTKNAYWFNNHKGGDAERQRRRSKTFPGIAAAMANQWGVVI